MSSLRLALKQSLKESSAQQQPPRSRHRGGPQQRRNEGDHDDDESSDENEFSAASENDDDSVGEKYEEENEDGEEDEGRADASLEEDDRRRRKQKRKKKRHDAAANMIQSKWKDSKKRQDVSRQLAEGARGDEGSRGAEGQGASSTTNAAEGKAQPADMPRSSSPKAIRKGKPFNSADAPKVKSGSTSSAGATSGDPSGNAAPGAAASESKSSSSATTTKAKRQAKTVPPPSAHVLEWISQMPVKRSRKNVAPGLRVKVRFATKLKRDGKIVKKKKWFGGRVSAVSKEGSKIRIKYDDGTSEVTRFPDQDVVVDDTANGTHQATADKFIPPPEEGEEYDRTGGVDHDQVRVEHSAGGTTEDRKEATQRQRIKEKRLEKKKRAKYAAAGEDATRDDTVGREGKDDEPLADDSERSAVSHGKKQKRDKTKAADGAVEKSRALSPVNVRDGTSVQDRDSIAEAGPKNSSADVFSADTSAKSTMQTEQDVTPVQVKRKRGRPPKQKPVPEPDVPVAGDAVATSSAATSATPKAEMKSPASIREKNARRKAADLTAASGENGEDCQQDAAVGNVVEMEKDNDAEGDMGDTLSNKSKPEIVTKKKLTDVSAVEESETAAGEEGVQDVQQDDILESEPASNKIIGAGISGDRSEADSSGDEVTKPRPSITIRLGKKKKKLEDDQREEDGTGRAELEEDGAPVAAEENETSARGKSEAEDDTKLTEKNEETANLTTKDRPKKRSLVEMETESGLVEKATEVDADDKSPEAPPAKRLHIHIPAPKVEVASMGTADEKDREKKHESEKKRKRNTDSDEAAQEPGELSPHPKKLKRKSTDEFDSSQANFQKESDVVGETEEDGLSPRDLDQAAKVEGVPREESTTVNSDEKAITASSPVDDEAKTPADMTTQDLPANESRMQAEAHDDEALTPRPERSDSKQDLSAVRSGRRAAKQANQRISSKQELVHPESIKKKKKRDKGDSEEGAVVEGQDEDSQWVQCDSCGKWRIIPNIIVESLGQKWFCHDNVWDPKRMSCDAPEQTAKQAQKEKKRRKRMIRRLELEKAAQAEAAENRGAQMADEEKGSQPDRARSPRPREEAPPIVKGKRSSPEGVVQPSAPQQSRSEKKGTSLGKKVRSDPPEPFSPVPDGETKPRGRGRPRRNANKETGRSSGSGVSEKQSQGDDADNLEWVQCEKCQKWRQLPSHVSADELPDVWYCSLNTWNPNSASCDAPEDKADGLQDIGFHGGGGGGLSYRNLIFGSTGRKANRPVSERTRAAESLFLVPNDDEDAPPVVMYANSSAFLSRSRNNASADENETMSVLELMDHSNLWAELRSMSTPFSISSTDLVNRHRQGSCTFETLPRDIRKMVKELILHILGNETLSSDEIVLAAREKDTKDIPSDLEKAIPFCTVNVVVTTLCELVKRGHVECLQSMGPKWTIADWNPRYRRTKPLVVGDATPADKSAVESVVSHKVVESPKPPRFMKIAKPWKRPSVH